ncbi:serpentine type 7TM GPCR chemoreceptor srt domain-containing protein [Ditylenchus destructor]|nr:serpentine type 7TM GPCR chemoreceptor srt domain-containing protein [Ditylenchus destructor]
MFSIGVSDVICLWINAFFTGLSGITGTVFCSSQNFNFFVGGIGMMMWFIETSTAVVLALNRCLDLCAPKWNVCLFKGWRTYLWIATCWTYGLSIFAFTKPGIISPFVMSHPFNPHFGYIDDTEMVYENRAPTVHNPFVIVAMITLYGIFAVKLSKKWNRLRQTGINSRNRRAMSIFIQVVLLSFMNVVAAAGYVSMQYVQLSFVLVLIIQYGWIFTTGVPSLIYLFLNRAIRTDILRMIAQPWKIVTISAKIWSTVVNNTSRVHEYH